MYRVSGAGVLSEKVSALSVAIVELTGVHEEIIPSLVDALPVGTRTQVFVNQRCKHMRGDLFAETEGVNASVTYVDIVKAPDWDKLGGLIDAGGHDVLIISTFQIDGIAKWARKRKLPLIGVVHNPMIFGKSEACKAALVDEGLGCVVLAPHVAARLNAMTRGAHMDAIGVVEPVFWGTGDRRKLPDDGRKRVVVPGGVNYAVRDFEGLLSALNPERVARLRDAGIVLQIIGGGPDRSTLQSALQHGQLDDVVELLPLSDSGRVPYAAYVEALRQARAVYPLLPLAWPPYRDHKITSAIPTAIGFGLPLVLDRWTASVYRVPALVVDASIAAAVDGIIGLDHATRDGLREETTAYRMAIRNTNTKEMDRLLLKAMASALAFEP